MNKYDWSHGDTFTEPMPLSDDTMIPPTGKAFKLQMATVGHWNDEVMMRNICSGTTCHL